jgi:hypothetical protein
MTIDKETVLENLKVQRTEIEKALESNREMYLKIQGAIEILEQIEEQNSESEEEPEEEPEEGKE